MSTLNIPCPQCSSKYTDPLGKGLLRCRDCRHVFLPGSEADQVKVESKELRNRASGTIFAAILIALFSLVLGGIGFALNNFILILFAGLILLAAAGTAFFGSMTHIRANTHK